MKPEAWSAAEVRHMEMDKSILRWYTQLVCCGERCVVGGMWRRPRRRMRVPYNPASPSLPVDSSPGQGTHADGWK